MARLSDSQQIAFSQIRGRDISFSHRLEVLLEQRYLAVLGRKIDLKSLLTARVRRLMQLNAECLISRFESNYATSIVELESQASYA